MTKHVLEVDFDYDFDLVGISCHLRDYRLCWLLNKSLGIELVRDTEGAETPQGLFALFSGKCPETRTIIHLLVNRGPDGWMIPEQRQADFLLMLRENAKWNTEDLVRDLKNHNQILTAFAIDPNGLKSKENLLLNDL